MKKSLKHLIFPLAVVGMLSCGATGGFVIRNMAMYSYDLEKGAIGTFAQTPLLFYADEQIPYIAVGDAYRFASAIRSSFLEDPQAGFTFEKTLNGGVVKDELGDTATFDLNKQTITFSDFDSFVYGRKGMNYPNSIGHPRSDQKSFKAVEGESVYKKGKEVVIDLNAYPSLSLKSENEVLYIPYAVYNDLLVGGPTGLMGFAYNFKDPYFANVGPRDFSTGELTDIGKKFYGDAPKKAEISKGLASFAYDETMFSLDYFYGLKGVKGVSSFKSYAKENGYEDDLLSGNLSKIDDAYCKLFLKLDDGHTAPLGPSALSDISEFAIDDSWRSEKSRQKDVDKEKMDNDRKAAKKDKPFEVVGNTAFLFFDDFLEIDEKALYGTLTEEAAAKNNPVLFAYAYQQIKKDPNIKNVVVDLATNNGGDSDGLIYCLGTLLGKVSFDSGNPLSGSHTHMTYLTDINVDGKIDDNDVPLVKTHNIYMLDSHFAFSCGNLFPCAAKVNSDKVKTIGERTGGGTCTVKNMYNGIGSSFVSSSLTMLYKPNGNGYTHIEDGADVDIPLGLDKMLDRDYIVNLINK